MRLWLTSLACLVAATPSLAEETKKGPLHLYLLVGQSNMAGRGKVSESDKVPHPRVMMFTKEQQWKPATDPLHFDKPTIVGVGLGSSFGRTVAEENPKVTVGLIPCAVGGTPLSRWQEGGDLYEAAMKRAKAALKDGQLKGILWHQGEAESNSQERSESYSKRLTAMIQAMRKELDAPQVPFVCGKLGEFLYPQERFPFAKTVNQQLEKVAETVPYVAVVESSGLSCKSDDVHFDAASLREFGKRYAKAYFGLTEK